jgi:hypothetical protein
MKKLCDNLTKLDISKDDFSDKDIYEHYNNSLFKKWIKLIPSNISVLLDKYHRKDYFNSVANILLDTELFVSGKKKGMKKRNTTIQFVPTIPIKEFNEKVEWLYLFVINNVIVKIGGTRTGLKGRTSSYLCGHHIKERGKSGDCSKTNGYIYNTFEFYLKLGYKLKMYGYKLPKTDFTIEIFNKKIKVVSQTYHAYESTFLEDYKKKYNNYPILNDNCDPNYKE